MAKYYSLNEHKGTAINELEATLAYLQKLLDKKIEEKPAGGFIMAKGKPNEIRLKFIDMKRVLNSLSSKLGLEGSFSFGVCKTCTRYESLGGCTGTCGSRNVHEYDSCAQHSKQGGGFGL